jgi:D-alanyl-D-alanine carboxypeptidase
VRRVEAIAWAATRSRGWLQASSSRPVFSVIVAMLLLVPTACRTDPTPAASPSPPPGAVLQRLLAEDADEHHAGAIAFVEAHGRSWQGAAGDYQQQHEVHPGDRFDLGSTGKTFVATVVLQLVEEGRLSLDDSVEQWLPGDVDGGRVVLIRHLLNHTSGLTVTPSGRITVINPPGTVYGYSNTDYGLLENIVSEVTGRRLGQEVRDRILVPLGLEDTWMSPKGASPPWLGAPEGSCALCLPSGGGPNSTMYDVAGFFQALLGGELLGDDMMATMMHTVPTGTEAHAGLGVFRFDLPCGSAWGHGGEFTYYSNQVLVSRDGSAAVVVARNARDWYSIKMLAEEMYCAAI